MTSPTPIDTSQDDFKLVIFGWITTVLGIPKDGDPKEYNELTDRLYDLYTAHIKEQVEEARKDELNLMVRHEDHLDDFDTPEHPYAFTAQTWRDIRLAQLLDRKDGE